MTLLTSLAVLFLSAFLSATLLPGSSEVLLIGMLHAANTSVTGLVAVASAGNIAGACINWLLGTWFHRFKDRRWFPLSDATNLRAQTWFNTYGIWSLLLSWVPVFGDPLTLIAGILRVPFWRFVLLISAGKIARYGFIAVAWRAWDAS